MCPFPKREKPTDSCEYDEDAGLCQRIASAAIRECRRHEEMRALQVLDEPILMGCIDADCPEQHP